MVISFELSRPARLVLAVRGPGPTCKLAGSIGIAANRGLNLFPFDGLIRNRPLRPGTYKVTIRAKEAVKDLARTFVTIVAPGVPVKARVRPKCTEPTPLGHGLETSTLPPFAVGALTDTLIASRGDDTAATGSNAAGEKATPAPTSGTLGDREEGVRFPPVPPLPTSDELERVLAILLTPILLALLLTAAVAAVRRRRLRRWARW